MENSESYKIDWLDLALGTKHNNIINSENNKFLCLFSKEYPHDLHSHKPEHNMLNSIIDMHIQLAESLKRHEDRVQRILERSTKILSELKTFIPKENLDYIKDQNTAILRNMKESPTQLELISKKLIEIENRLKEIKNILLA